MSISVSQKLLLPRGAWRTVVLLGLVACINYLDRTMLTTMRESITQAIPMTSAQFGLLTAAFLWAYGIMSPFAGFIADRFNRSHVIIISLMGWSMATVLTAYTHSFEQLLATRIVLGISEAFYIPAGFALIVDYHKDATRSLASGIHIAGISLGQSLGFIGGWMAERHSWNTPFFWFGFIGIGYSILLIFTLKDVDDQPQNQHSKKGAAVNFVPALKSLFSRPAFLLLLGLWSILYIIGWIIIGWMPTFYQDHFRLRQGLAGVYATAYLYPSAIIGVIVGGYLTDRWTKRNKQAILLVPIIGLMIAAPCVFIASSTTLLPVAVVLFVIYGLTRAFSDANIMPILCLVTESKYRATGFGILNLFACILGGIGIYAGGALRDQQVDLQDIFEVAALLMIGAILLLYLIQRTISIRSLPESV